MARNIEIDINHVIYCGVTAPAKDQVEMLQIASRSGLLPAISDTVTKMGLVASLAAVDATSFNRLKVLCLTNGKIVRQSDNVPVAENLFQDDAHNFLMLIGRVLKENIGPFWQLSSSEGADEGPNSEAVQAQK
ncbi:phage tail assembly chaperone [Serratia aquatilis]|uniref:Phage tail assembly chaperone n=1 Tax=Serratia aquatilis TaxID=1737515 RepID=A0ABV6EEI0_9GAMM